MLKAQDLQKSYGAKQVLSGVSLSVSPGESVCVAGKNAQGKTTLLSIVAGVVRPDGGRVLCARPIALVPQQAALLPGLTVADNLWLYNSAHGKTRRALFAPGSPEERLGLAPFAKKRAGELSGGYQRRLSIAGALAGRPGYLVLDEPFAGLDVDSAEQLTGLLLGLAGEGMGLLFSSHQPERIAALAGRLLVLQAGAFQKELVLPRPLRREQALDTVMRALGARVEHRARGALDENLEEQKND